MAVNYEELKRLDHTYLWHPFAQMEESIWVKGTVTGHTICIEPSLIQRWHKLARLEFEVPGVSWIGVESA